MGGTGSKSRGEDASRGFVRYDLNFEGVAFLLAGVEFGLFFLL